MQIGREDLRIFKAIGKIQSAISTAETLDEAIRSGLKVILENSMADYAVIWYETKKETGESVLKPYYWICPADLTSISYSEGKGLPGIAYKNKTRETLVDFEKEADERTKAEFSDLSIGSAVCVPLSALENITVCIEFFKEKEHGQFSEDEMNVCELLALLGQTAIKDCALPSAKEEDKKVLLSAHNIVKSFKSGEETTTVLNKVNFDVFEGEFLCFLGESGCGKSSLLNIIGGILAADGGSLKFKGEELIGLSKEKLTAFRRKNIGYIFQSYNLMPNLNVRENLNLISELVDEPADEIETLELVGMADKASHYPSQLSGGQQQRVAIARALVKKPCLILADEPTAALDYKTSIEVLSVLEKIKKSGTTLIVVTHNEEITRMADRIIRFKGGRSYETIVNARPVKATELEW